jgi:hypothetical protein
MFYDFKKLSKLWGITKAKSGRTYAKMWRWLQNLQVLNSIFSYVNQRKRNLISPIQPAHESHETT